MTLLDASLARLAREGLVQVEDAWSKAFVRHPRSRRVGSGAGSGAGSGTTPV
jgi:hypothetical protein